MYRLPSPGFKAYTSNYDENPTFRLSKTVHTVVKPISINLGVSMPSCSQQFGFQSICTVPHNGAELVTVIVGAQEFSQCLGYLILFFPGGLYPPLYVVYLYFVFFGGGYFWFGVFDQLWFKPCSVGLIWGQI